MYESSNKDKLIREVGMATVEVVHALARALPTIVTLYACCYVVGLMVSAPYEISCKSALKPKRRVESTRLIEPKPPAPAVQEPVIKAKDE